MGNKICFDKTFFFVLLFFLVIIFIYSAYFSIRTYDLNKIKKNPNPQFICPKCPDKCQKNIGMSNEEHIFRKNISDKLRPPERIYRIPVNISTQGELPTFQKIGILKKVDGSLDTDNDRLPLFGRPKYSGSNDYEYYVIDGSRNFNKIPLNVKQRELLNNDQVDIPGFGGTYETLIYDYQRPKYIPY